MRKRYLALGFLLLIGFGLTEVDRYTRKQPQQANAPQDQEPDYYGEQLINRQFNAQGELTQTFTAQRMNHLPGSKLSEFEQPLIHASGENEQPWTVSARQAQMPDGGNVMIFIDDVEIRPLNAEPDQDVLIETQWLRYDSRKEFAETEQPVTVTSLTTQLSATGMRLDLRNQQLTFKQQVNTRYAPHTSE